MANDMKFFIKILLFAAAVFTMVFLRLGVTYFLPFPFNSINVMLAIPILVMLATERGAQSIWLTYAGHFFVEMYTTTAFGIVLFSSTLSILFAFWLSQILFTNKSWRTALAITVFSIVSYRLLYTALIAVSSRFEIPAELPLTLLIRLYGWELLWTSAAVAILTPVFVAKSAQRRTLFLR